MSVSKKELIKARVPGKVGALQAAEPRKVQRERRKVG